MSLSDIHARAARFNARIHRRNLMEYVAGATVIAAFSYYALAFPDPLIKAGSVLVVLGALYVGWRLATTARANALPDQGGAQTWVEFHRAELVRQRDALRSVWRWYLAPFAPGLLVFFTGSALSAPGPLLWAKLGIAGVSVAVAAAVFAFIAWLNARAARRIEMEIEALDRARAA